ncbi:MAG: FAD-dependent oxidoreductase [Roseivivax sp.]|nr:FAD-dependent oxidoreductase [Roseivivax sp.]
MFDQTQGPRRKLAIVGGGISGMAAAYHLSASHDVTLFEAAPRLGGHARTVVAGRRNDQPVDTGFIVFNYATYPNLTRLFRDLDVPVMKSHMSFGASIDGGRIEYSLDTLRSITAQRRNLLRPQFYGMVADIFRFGQRAEAAAQDGMTIGELVEQLRLGRWFREYYLLPMCGAIWSTPVAEIDRFPARSLVRFFRNHGLLSSVRTHQWWTVQGGSIEYVRRLQAAMQARGATVRTGAPVRAVTRDDLGVTITAGGGHRARFDEVVLACHSDQALALLGQGATGREAAALGAIRYQSNRAVLHRDPSQMPRRRDCWSSWVYRSQQGRIGVTYWMNQLQGIPQDDPLFVTLNPTAEIAPDAIYDTVDFAHPVFDTAAVRAQDEVRALQGQNRTWFAGAYNRHGFHEDGIASAMRVVRMLNDRLQTQGMDHEIDGQGAEVEVPFDLRAFG